jgi:hypothetical protein
MTARVPMPRSMLPAPTIVTFIRRLLKLSGANDGELVIVVPGEALA